MEADDIQDFERRRDDGYRALGRYMTEFSELVSVMERGIEEYLHRCGVPLGVSRLPAAGLTADGMVSVFFGMAREVHSHDDKEKNVSKRLRGKVREELPFRNDVAHGLWQMGGVTVENNTELVPVPPTALRTKPGREGGASVMVREDLDAKSESIRVLTGYLHMYSMACFKEDSPGIRDYIRLDGDKRLVPGPKGPQSQPPH